ncbi:hypothetical protein [Mycobacterium sp.]|uniref:hypothetical protein n=1 Tax=Mycobacterium sp. TaxID=1785 RepID=UPI0031E4422B
MPNRRRRRLSTAMSAIAALAVASPFAYVAACQVATDLASDTTPTVEHREFVSATLATDLPGELIAALSQGLSQFGINLPPVPSLSGSTSASSPGLTSPGLTTPGLTSPGLTSPGLTTPGLTSPGLTSPGLANPGLANPALTSPSATTPGLTSPAGGDPTLINPDAGLPAAGEVPISAPIGLDPGVGGTYPILGDPSLGAGSAASTPASGGLVNDLLNTANQLGAGQAIDLLKGLLMPSITQAVQNANPAAAAAAAAPEDIPPAPAA